MVHIVNLQVPSRNLVGIGLHGSIHGLYGTQLTQTYSEPSPNLGRIPKPCGTHHTCPHARGTPHVARIPMESRVGLTLRKIREREGGWLGVGPGGLSTGVDES